MIIEITNEGRMKGITEAKSYFLGRYEQYTVVIVHEKKKLKKADSRGNKQQNLLMPIVTFKEKFIKNNYIEALSLIKAINVLELLPPVENFKNFDSCLKFSQEGPYLKMWDYCSSFDRMAKELTEDTMYKELSIKWVEEINNKLGLLIPLMLISKQKISWADKIAQANEWAIANLEEIEVAQ